MSTFTLDELRDLCPAYVMGTLSPDESRAFDAAMAQADVAAALAPEIDAHRAAVEFLATMQPVPAPAGLRERVLARIAADESASPAPAVAAPATSAPSAVPALTVSRGAASVPASASPVSPVSPRFAEAPARRGSRTGWVMSGLLATALAASAVFAIDQRRQVTALSEQLGQQIAANEKTAGALTEKEKTLQALLDGGNDLTLVQLTASAPSGPAMQVFWNQKAGRGTVNATGLAPIANDRAYCLWVIQDGKPVAVKLFRVDRNGNALVENVTLPAGGQGVAAFAVTEEPAAGSPQPTMTPFLVGAVPKS